jgi:hypothetical protein
MKMYQHERDADRHVRDIDDKPCRSEFSPVEYLYPMGFLAFAAGGRTAQDLWASPVDLAGVDLERLDRALDMLPPIEADIYELSSRGCSQADLARVFGMTQPGISHRLQNAIFSLELILRLPDITEAGIRRDLGPHLEPRLLETLVIHRRTSNYLHTAERMGLNRRGSVTQTIKLRVLRAIDIVRDLPEAKPYIEFFRGMIANPMAWSNHRSHRPTREKRLALEAQKSRELAATFALTSERQSVESPLELDRALHPEQPIAVVRVAAEQLPELSVQVA